MEKIAILQYTIDERPNIHACGKMLTLLHLECTFGWTTLKINHQFDLYWKILEEGLLLPSGVPLFSQIFLKIMICFQDVPL